MCGEYVAEGSHVCWKCRGKISKCNVCRNKDKNICLVCENWRFSKYDSDKRMQGVQRVQDTVQDD